jgi:hypothetical protein
LAFHVSGGDGTAPRLIGYRPEEHHETHFGCGVAGIGAPEGCLGSAGYFNNERGSISISYSGIESKGSQMVYCFGVVPPEHHSLGPISFSTGALPSGSLETGGKFSPICSSFVVIGRGNYGEPKGVIFSGNFFGPIKWTLISKTGAVLIFKLTGNIEGIFFNGRMIRASARQTIVTTEEQLAKGIGHIASDRVLVTP